MVRYDRIIIGAGLYGLYAARLCGKRGEKILVLEYDKTPFGRATYINQARVHMGYHYPRSLATAVKSAGYFRRFVEDFGFCIYNQFNQIYATSDKFSWTNARQFMDFCKIAKIRCDEIIPEHYFKPGMCDGAFMTQEYTYDAKLLQNYYEEELEKMPNVKIIYEARIEKIIKKYDLFEVWLQGDLMIESPFVLNATYASINQVIDRVEGVEKKFFNIKYELCEIILCEPSKMLKDNGITVMDGPFFSIMPFGKTGFHSLTSVTFTPHVTSYEKVPVFECQKEIKTKGVVCSEEGLGNCNTCPNRPESAWEYMSHLANKYLKEEYNYIYKKSLYSMKPILKTSEVDDSRPTAIKVLCKEPTFISVLSGKINTVYDLDEYLV